MAAEIGTAVGTTQGAQARLPAQHVLGGRYAIGSQIRRGALTEIYTAQDTQTGEPVWVHVVHPQLVATDALAAVFADATARARAAPSERTARMLDAGRDGDHAFVVTAAIDGASLRELLARKQATGGAGFGARGTSGILSEVCAALAPVHRAGLGHGALSIDSIYASPSGAVVVADLGIGALVPAAVQAGQIQAPASLAPEDARDGAARPAGDIFSAGHLLYTCVVGQELRKGGRRPSELGVPSTVDELVARCVSAQPEGRPASVEALAQLLGRAMTATPSRPQVRTPPRGQPSLAQGLSPRAVGSNPRIGEPSSPGMAVPGASAGGLDPNEEKWLVSKGRLDYGPFSMAHVIEQIEKGEILPGHRIVDKDTGQRWQAEDHPMLARLVEEATRRRDELRRASAEEQHVKTEQRRGVVLYGVIAAVALALAGVAYAIVTRTGESAEEERAGLETVGEGALAIKISEPVTPKQAPKPRRSGGGGGGGNNNVLDLSKEGGDARLDNDTINQVIQRNGRGLGGCLSRHRAESSSANIAFVIMGASGRVSSVTVNGGQSGGLYVCIKGVMRSMQFPRFDGARTRAEFDISL